MLVSFVLSFNGRGSVSFLCFDSILFINFYVFLLIIRIAATEKQAVNRCHRLGQESPVTVVKYIVEDSMEQRLHNLRNDPTVLETVENDVDDLEVPLSFPLYYI